MSSRWAGIVLPGLLGLVIGAGAVLLAGVAGLVRLPNGPVASFSNPVIATDFADPTTIRAADGLYYAYSTEQLTVDRMAYLQVARSRDLVHWELLPDALARKPVWAAATRDFWAPGAIEADGRTWLYFAALPDEGDGMCLGVASASTPAGPFEPVDQPLSCSPGFVDIDPMPFDDPVSGKRYLYWGSDGSPILARELAPDRTSFAEGSETIDVMRRDLVAPYEHLVEAPWVVHREGRYYLFYSGDDCCSSDPAYAVMVARADDPLGPYEKRGEALDEWGENVILHFSDAWVGPGHNALLTDGDGTDWLVYHAIDPESPDQPAVAARKRPMLIDRIEWVDGWPRIAGDQPSSGPVAAPVSP